MKIIVLGDLHLISPDDPGIKRHTSRTHFMESTPSYDRIIKLVAAEAPDLVISLGDVIDWYSLENVDFGIDRLNQLGTPWVMTPGNHDFQGYYPPGSRHGESAIIEQNEHTPIATKGWRDRGIHTGNQTIDAGRFQLLLMDSALSKVPEGTETWLDQSLARSSHNILFTHVPLDVPQTRTYIHQIDPKRNLNKYVQCGSSGLFEGHLKGRVDTVFSGHLHFPGQLNVSGTTFHLCPLSIIPTRRRYEGQGVIKVVTLNNTNIQVNTIAVEGV